MIDVSARLNAGHNGNLMKSVTAPGLDPVEQVADRAAEQHAGRQPQQRPLGSPQRGRRPARSARRAVTTSTIAPPPARKPKATPLLRTWTSETAGRNLCVSPTGDPGDDQVLGQAVEPEHDHQHARRARPGARARALGAAPRAAVAPVGDDRLRRVSAGDGIDHDRPHDVQDDDRDHRREVEPAHRRDQPPEQPQVGLGDVAQEAQERVGPARVGRAARRTTASGSAAGRRRSGRCRR